MLSLPWILVLALTLLRSLTAAPTSANTNRFKFHSEKLSNETSKLLNYACVADDATFYSPSGDRPECTKADLQCFSAELETMVNECLEGQTNPKLGGTYRRMKEYIDTLIKLDIYKNQSDCACENNQEKSYKDFLHSLTQMMQKVNSRL